MIKKKILIVEDEILFARDISRALDRFGYEVTDIADSFEAVIKCIESRMPDIILMDINIKGGKNGIETANVVRADYDIPVIYITGYSDDQTIEKAKLSEPYGFIVKPVKYEDIKIAVEIADYRHKADIQLKNAEKEKKIKEMMLLRSQRLASLGELSASIAHEIRQPLQVIKVITDSIIYWHEKNGNEPSLYGEQIDNLRKISDNANRINSIITELQSLVRKAASDDKKKISVNKAAADVAHFYNEKMKNHSVELIFDFYDGSSECYFPEMQMTQVLTNLINNSINAHDGTAKKDKKIIIKTLFDGDNCVLSVIDNATGIKEGMEEKIFDPLFTTKTNPENLGLGLYIVHNIVSSNNGTVKCRNNDIGGATFEISIPRHHD